jgi:hypothetical protein
MVTNNGPIETTKANFVNLCDVGTILGLSCVLPMLVSRAQKITNTYVKNIGLSLNSKHETKEPRSDTKVKVKNKKFVRPNYKQIFIVMKQKKLKQNKAMV